MRETYPFRVDVRTRFGDLDTNRHVNNVALAGWYLDALAELHLDVLGYPTGGPLDSLAPSSLRVDYLAEVHYPAIHQLRVGVVELDETSVRYACGLFDGPRCIGLAEATGGLSPDEDPELGKRLAAFTLRACCARHECSASSPRRTPAARSSASARSVVSGATPAQRPSSTVVAKPARRGVQRRRAHAVVGGDARRRRRRSPRARRATPRSAAPPGSAPSNPEYAAA